MSALESIAQDHNAWLVARLDNEFTEALRVLLSGTLLALVESKRLPLTNMFGSPSQAVPSCEATLCQQAR